MSPRLSARHGRSLHLGDRRSLLERLAGTSRLSLLMVMFSIVLSMVALILPGVAAAQSAPILQDQITDQTRNQMLTSSRPQIEAAIAELRDEQNIQLFVLFVETTGSQPVTDFANEVARRSSLGGNDVLLVVAVTDRSDALWRGAQMTDRLTDRELSDILTDRVEPLLARSDFGGAVAAAADGLGQAVVSTGTSAGQSAGGLGLSLSLIVLVVIVIVAGIWGWNAYSTRRRQREAEAERDREIEQLSQQANALLITADDALRDADEEIAFAEAQFGEEEIEPYREAVAHASEELRAAFTLRQQLDDDTPETPDVRRDMVQRMVQHATAAQAALDEQKERIDHLRDQERRAPEILAELPNQLGRVEARLPEIERTLSHLQRYADASWASVEGNVEQARQRLADARQAVAEGQAALSAGDRTLAGRAARTGLQGLGEAAQLLDAVQSLGAAVQEAERSAGPQIEAAAVAVRAARSALAGRETGDLTRRMAEAEAVLQEAQRVLAAAKPDVLAASRLATQADAAADAILAELRQEEERQERERRIAASQLQAAEASYAQAAHYIAARRRGMGSAARTRLAEAERALIQARMLVESEPQAAITHARRAHQLSEAAYALARQDFATIGAYGGFGGMSRGGVFPIPFPFPTGRGGGFGGGGGWGGGIGGGGSVGGGWGGGGSVGGRW
jgi:uncharacterized membrane protein YgcG